MKLDYSLISRRIHVTHKKLILIGAVACIVGLSSLVFGITQDKNQASKISTKPGVGQNAPQDEKGEQEKSIDNPEATATQNDTATPAAAASSSPTPKVSTPKVATPPAPTPFVLQTISASVTPSCAYDIEEMLPITRVVSRVVSIAIAPSYPGGSVTWRWEYDGDISDMYGLPAGQITQQVSAGARTFTLVSPDSTHSFDAEGYSDGFRMRAVVLAPTNVASSWIQVLGASSCGM